MDLTKLDQIITELEKKKSLRPGSPPVVINGNLGVWRTIRHNRMFIELDNGKLGKVLIGPPSFVDKKLGEVASDAWQALTPRETTKEFDGFTPASNGVSTLKESIKNSLGPDDTRRPVVDSRNEFMELVPIARSAGFSDDEIKQALKGNPPNKPLENRRSSIGRAPDSEKPEEDSKEKPKSNVVLFPRKKPVAEDEATEAGDAKEPPTEPIGGAKDVIVNEGNLAAAIRSVPNEDNERKRERILNFLKQWEGTAKDEIIKRKISSWRRGLESGAYEVDAVLKEMSEAAKDMGRLRRNKITDEQLRALKDHGAVQDLIDNFEERIDEKVDEAVRRTQEQFSPDPAPAAPDTQVSDDRIRELVEENRAQSERNKRESEKQRREAERLREEAAVDRRRAREALDQSQLDRMQLDAALELLSELSAKVESPQIQKEIREIRSQAAKSPFNKRSIFLRLYQLLQILLLLIPGI